MGDTVLSSTDGLLLAAPLGLMVRSPKEKQCGAVGWSAIARDREQDRGPRLGRATREQRGQ
jgi:hypothetical protein